MNFITVLNLHFIQVFFGWLVSWLGGGAGCALLSFADVRKELYFVPY
jgi:hypothetical protein